MLYYDSPSKDPYENLALEEHLFETVREGTVFMLWQNKDTIVVGKYQNPAEEIDRAYAEKNGIRIARRLSGGGTVYHDDGNLNYTIITDEEKNPDFDFRLFVRPVIKTLEKFGLHAAFNGRNDITINGFKFSGNSQYYKHGRVLHHGCIMLESDLTKLAKALRVKPAKFTSKSMKSVRSRVASINDFAKPPIAMDDFKETLAACVAKQETLEEMHLSEADKAAIQKLRDEKYSTEAWIYGHAPVYGMRAEKKFPAGLVTAHVRVQESRIAAIRFEGDFFGKGDPEELAEKLVGCRLDSTLIETLKTIDVPYYMSGITGEQLAELLL